MIYISKTKIDYVFIVNKKKKKEKNELNKHL